MGTGEGGCPLAAWIIDREHSLDLGLKGKVVLVTGGSKGIGLACARAFAAEGAKVAIVSRSEANLRAAAASLPGCMTVAADMSDADAARKMVDAVESALGPIDVLVNSAGAAKRAPPDEVTPADFRAAMDAKYFSYVNPIDAVIKRMAGRGRGAIVNIVGAGGKVASPIHLPGGAANAALMLLSTGLASAHARRGVRVNAINPGVTVTDRLKGGVAAEARLLGVSEDEVMRRGAERIPLGRYARPEEIASVALFLASDQASYVTGVVLTMDGGTTATVV